MKVNLIAAISLNNCIGKSGKVPWYISSDLKKFKELTSNKVVVMGANTFFDDLEGNPLPNRINFVLGERRRKIVNSDYNVDNLYFVNNYNTCVRYMKSFDKDVFIIGGSKIYNLFLPIVETFYITHVLNVVENGDVFLNLDYSKLNLINKEEQKEVIFATYKM